MKRFRLRLILTILCAVGGLALMFRPGFTPRSFAQSTTTPAYPAWLRGFLYQAKHAHTRGFLTIKPPAVIPQDYLTADPTGILENYQPGGPTTTSNNAFFQSFGTNGRTCFSCHQPETAWSITPGSVQNVFDKTRGQDPVFADFDGQNCPNTLSASPTLLQRKLASSLLLNKGLIRIGLGLPDGTNGSPIPEWKYLKIIKDPTGCENNSTFGITSPVPSISMYRRPLNSTNLTMNGQLLSFVGPPFPVSQQGSIMWDGREPSLAHQADDATLGHAQATGPLSSGKNAEAVAFETGIFTAQYKDQKAGLLTAKSATGGAKDLSTFAAVVNTLFNLAGFNPDFFTANPAQEFDMFLPWFNNTAVTPQQASIARGEDIFNNKSFFVNGVSGFNEIVGQNAPTTCSTCHSNVDSGSDVVPGFRHLGIGDNVAAEDVSGQGQSTATVLPATKDLPLFEFWCPVGSIDFFTNTKIDPNDTTKSYDVLQTNDPGVALISGKCNDLGQFKVPRLRGFAARAPYFHNGNAATAWDVVNFYNVRFSIGLSYQDKTDLVNFLNSL